jgi:hypothetical protein
MWQAWWVFRMQKGLVGRKSNMQTMTRTDVTGGVKMRRTESMNALSAYPSHCSDEPT